MSLRNKDVDWEREYQLKTIWPIEPHNLTSKIPKYISTGSILDLGAGEGHDAVYLAKLGYRVTAVDISETVLERITKLARQSNCELTTQQASIEEYQPRCTYDGMISYGALQFLGPKGDERIRALQAATSASGLHSFYVFANRGDFSDLAKHKFWFPSESELRSLYID